MGRIKYLLDTNILSEPPRKMPNPHVMHYFHQYDGQYATAAIVWHELHYGCELLADSKRKIELKSYLQALKEGGLIILNYDQKAAEWNAKQRATLQEQGKIQAYAEGKIAAIAAVNQLTLVTGNTDSFVNFNNLSLENWFK